MSISSLSRDKYLTFFSNSSCKILGGALKTTGTCLIPLAVAHLCKAASFFSEQPPVFSASLAGTDVTEWSQSKEQMPVWCFAAATAGFLASKILCKAGDYVLTRASLTDKPFDAAKEA